MKKEAKKDDQERRKGLKGSEPRKTSPKQTRKMEERPGGVRRSRKDDEKGDKLKSE